MRKLCGIAFLIILLSTGTIGGEFPRSYMTYWDKGNSGQQLNYSEFKILISELEKCMLAFKDKFSKLSVEDANFSYKTGREWETVHTSTVKQFGYAFECLETIKKFPNQIAPSFILYVILTDFIVTSSDFAKIDKFSNDLNNTHIGLSGWTRAFQKAHLNRLAEAKDRGLDLYKLK